MLLLFYHCFIIILLFYYYFIINLLFYLRKINFAFQQPNLLVMASSAFYECHCEVTNYIIIINYYDY